MKATIKKLFAINLAVALLPGICHSTDVSGTINGGHWTMSNAPYRAVGDIYVNTLTIDPGVTVYFTNKYVFEVDGDLTAIGNPNKPIVFTSTNGTVGWNGIYFNAAGAGSQMTWCRVANSVNSGIRVQDSSPVIRNCVITNNTAANGGGIWVLNSAYDLELDNCTIVNNQAKDDGSGTGGNGAGIFALMGTGWLRLVGTTVSGNSTVPVSPWHNLYGGGLYVQGNAILQSNSVVTANTVYNDQNSAASGGGLFCSSGTTIVLNSSINSNALWLSHSSYTWGSGIYLNSGQLLATNSIISYNSGNYTPVSAVYVKGGTAALVNCTVAYNATDGLNLAGGSVSALNSIFFYNSYNGSSYGTQITGSPTANFCDVQNGYGGVSNILLNPRFHGPTDLWISYNSPCVDAGSTNPIYNDVSFPPSWSTARNDIGAHGGPGAAAWYSAPTILVPLVDQYALTNTSLCISAGVAGAFPLNYQWYYGTNVLTGETSGTLCFSSAQLINNGSYSVVVTNIYGAITNGPFSFTVTTNGGAILDINMYAGITIGGLPGRKYVLDYTTDAGPSPVWAPLATNIMSSLNWFYVDMTSPFQPRRFYRVELR